MIETLRQYRILDYAVFDLLLAFVGMAILSPLLSKLFLKMGINIPKRSWVIWALPIGIVAHLLVGNITLMTGRFIDPSGHYLLKIVIAVLVVAGFYGVKKVKK